MPHRPARASDQTRAGAAILERYGAGRLQGWGIGVLVCASLFWVYAAWQVLTPYDSTYNAVDCPAPVNSEPRDIYFEGSGYAHEKALQCPSDEVPPACGRC